VPPWVLQVAQRVTQQFVRMDHALQRINTVFLPMVVQTPKLSVSMVPAQTIALHLILQQQKIQSTLVLLLFHIVAMMGSVRNPPRPVLILCLMPTVLVPNPSNVLSELALSLVFNVLLCILVKQVMFDVETERAVQIGL
jgi:hypothetical protein